jgi:hypothetical protein
MIPCLEKNQIEVGGGMREREREERRIRIKGRKEEKRKWL